MDKWANGLKEQKLASFTEICSNFFDTEKNLESSCLLEQMREANIHVFKSHDHNPSAIRQLQPWWTKQCPLIIGVQGLTCDNVT